MDLTRFSDPDFDVKEWVNGALRAHKDPTTPLDVRISMSAKIRTISWVPPFTGLRLYPRNEAAAVHSGSQRDICILPRP